MKDSWIYFFTGIVQVVIKGKGTERFLNDCIRHGIIIWNVVRKKSGDVSFFIRLKDVQALRKVVRKNECSCTFKKRKGLPFLIKRSNKNMGVLVGIVLFISITFILSNMIWEIEIKGAQPENEHLIEKELANIGIKKGAFQFLIPEPEKIQKYVMNQVDDITWIGVELVGTTYQIEVVEKQEPPEKEYVSPRHIVAKKEAVISKMFVEKGQPMVSVHEYVNKGQILVSGLIGNEEENKLVAAKGEIFGETWYQSLVEVPLKSTFNVLTGESLTKHKISFGSISFPIWGFNKVEYKQYETEKVEHSFRFLKWTLPITYQKETYRESEAVIRVYNKEEAREKGIEIAKKDIKEKLGEKDQIINEKVLHQSFENGKVKVKILFQVIEDIVETKPIIQGD